MTTFAAHPAGLRPNAVDRPPSAESTLATFIPMLLITVPGGTLADRVDRRRLVLVVTIGQAVLSAVLFALSAFGDASLWALYALVALGSASARSTRPPGRRSSPGWCRGSNWRGVALSGSSSRSC